MTAVRHVLSASANERTIRLAARAGAARLKTRP